MTISIRQSVQADGFSHGKLPIPAASRIGPFVASGNIFGYDFAEGKHPDGAAEQCALMFGHLREVVKAAGITLEDIIKMTVYLRDESVRAVVDQHWLLAFPDTNSRPARQTIVQTTMPAKRLIACDILAIASDFNQYYPSVGAAAQIPERRSE